jgi:hypothetical protein
MADKIKFASRNMSLSTKLHCCFNDIVRCPFLPEIE